MVDNYHPQVLLAAGLYEDEVDEKLAPVLRLAWLAGIETMSGCQNAGESLADLPSSYSHMADYVQSRQDVAYIDFYNGGIEDFLNLVTLGKPSEAMWDRMYHWTTLHAWHKTLLIPPINNVFTPFGAQLSFPISDLAEIEACLDNSVDP